MSIFSQRHYIAVAKLLHRMNKEAIPEGRMHVIGMFTGMFKRDNSKFEPDIFVQEATPDDLKIPEEEK